MCARTPVDRLYQEAIDVLESLRKNAEASLHISVADNLRKVLVLAAASHFEHRLCTVVSDFVREASKGALLLQEFVRNKAISRQYHTWFQWEGSNANQFFSLFGASFRTHMAQEIKASEPLSRSIRTFLELGNERNRLVHGDYATFPMEKTLQEVYTAYQEAMLFVDMLPGALRECDRLQREDIDTRLHQTARESD
jgi:hypothetical protein